MRDLVAKVLLDKVELNGCAFVREGQLQEYIDALGCDPQTTDAGDEPAPVGHRNNQFHLFESLGVYLTEHHATRLIQSINFALVPEECPGPISSAFSGNLGIGGVAISPGMKESDYPSDAPIKFESALAGSWKSVGKGLSIYISTMGRNRPGQRRRTEVRYVTCVSVCLLPMLAPRV